jgi:sulfate-transporting ATPase
MLLLDEPTNHLDAESVAWLERFLHDFRAPWSPSPTTATSSTTPPAGSWSWTAATASPTRATTPAGWSRRSSAWSRRERQEASHQKAIKHELEWVRSNPKGRQAKSKARLARFEELQSQEFQSRNETNEIYIPPGPRLGDKVIEANGLRKTYGDRLLFEDLSASACPRAASSASSAPTAGKTTLFRMITGQEQPDGGEIEGRRDGQARLRRPSRDALDGEQDVWEEISDGLDVITIGKLRGALARLRRPLQLQGLRPAEIRRDLSGGERNRVHLAKLLKQGATCCCSTSPPTTSTSRPCARWKRRCWPFPAAWW